MKQMENEMNVNVPLEVIKASEIEPKEVKWLWYPYIPYGKVTLLQGDPGDGKSKLMLSIAALLSKGEPLPFTETEENEPKYEPARHISKTLNEIDSMGQKTFTGKMAISQKDYSELTALAKEGITSRAEIKKFEQSANFYRQKYMDSANALERMKTKYNELKEKCRPFLEALEHFPEVAKLFTEKVKQLFSFKEAQEQAEKEAREKERQERIKARRNKRGMER